MILYFLSGGSGGMADALDSGSSRSYPVRVQVSSSAFLLLGAVVLWNNGFFIFNKKRRTPKGSNIKFLTFFNKGGSTFRTAYLYFTFSSWNTDFLFTSWAFINVIHFSLFQ